MKREGRTPCNQTGCAILLIIRFADRNWQQQQTRPFRRQMPRRRNEKPDCRQAVTFSGGAGGDQILPGRRRSQTPSQTGPEIRLSYRIDGKLFTTRAPAIGREESCSPVFGFCKAHPGIREGVLDTRCCANATPRFGSPRRDRAHNAGRAGTAAARIRGAGSRARRSA